MDLDTVVLAAATAIVGVAQLGIVVTSRTKGLRDALYVGIPSVAVVVLFMLAWWQLGG